MFIIGFGVGSSLIVGSMSLLIVVVHQDTVKAVVVTVGPLAPVLHSVGETVVLGQMFHT